LGRWEPSDPGNVAPLCVPQVTPWVVGTLSVMGPCWYMEKKTNLLFLLICISVLSPALPMDPGEQEEQCRNFTIGSVSTKTFYSPAYPRNYPRDITCTKVITAEYGYFVRIDFRDMFRIEPASNDGKCAYDYLEIRDGDQGYSTEIGTFCGSDFPPIITSSSRSLWLRFVSDQTIEYGGFKAVYDYIPNPLETLPLIAKCEFELGGPMGYLGNSNVSEEHIAYATKYGEPIDCTWIITADPGSQIFIQFAEFELAMPNDCNFNYIQLFDGETDIEGQIITFCGSIAESKTTDTNTLYVRYFAEAKGIGSEFAAWFSVLKQQAEGEDKCKEGFYDCDDTYCIDESLLCNGIRNCKFGWDEETCSSGEGGGIPVDFSKTENIVIVLILIAIMIGMCTGMIYNLVRKLSEDKEDVIASREKSLASLAASACSIEQTQISKSRSRLTLDDEEARNGCYVPNPEGGFPFNTKV